MQPTLTVHMGCAKGGSTAIQRFLRKNAAALRERGVVVPTVDFEPGSTLRGNQIDYFQGIIHDGRARPVEGLAERLLALLRGDGAGQIVISAENLCNPVGFEAVIAPLTQHFRVRLLMYVRRQDDYLESAWQQWYVKEGRSLLSWIIANVGVVADWHQMLLPWAETFGDDALTVRRFDRDQLVGGDIVADFCEYTGIDCTGLKVPKREANASYDSRVSAIVEGRGELFDGPHDRGFYQMLRSLTDDAILKKPDSPRLFSTEERRAIMARYRDSNECLRARWLPDVEPPLFPPGPPVVSVDRLDQGALAGYELALLQRQIRALYDRVVALENG